MAKYFISILLIITPCVKSQNYISIDNAHYIGKYLYDFQDDSLNSDSRKQQDMMLFIGSKYSLFENYVDFLSDSLFYNIKDNNPQAALGKVFAKTSQYRLESLAGFRVVKDLSTHNTSLKEYLSLAYYQVNEKIQFNWELIDEQTKIISNLKCKKAICYYRGRNYTAWYTMEIPISEGPYKFNGLPGLIVKLYDNKKQHIFTLESFKKITYNRKMFIENKEYKDINCEQYRQTKTNWALEKCRNIQDPNFLQTSSDVNLMEIAARIKSHNNYIEKY